MFIQNYTLHIRSYVPTMHSFMDMQLCTYTFQSYLHSFFALVFFYHCVAVAVDLLTYPSHSTTTYCIIHHKVD